MGTNFLATHNAVMSETIAGPKPRDFVDCCAQRIKKHKGIIKGIGKYHTFIIKKALLERTLQPLILDLTQF